MPPGKAIFLPGLVLHLPNPWTTAQNVGESCVKSATKPTLVFAFAFPATEVVWAWQPARYSIYNKLQETVRTLI